MSASRSSASRSADSAELSAAALAFDRSPSAALVFAADGRLERANAAAEQMFGRGLSLFRRMRLDQALPAGDDLPRLAARATAEGVMVRERGVAVHLPEGAALYIEAIATPLPEGALLLTLIQPAHLDAADQHADRLRSAAGMGRTLAHEVKNPLAGIRGAAQLLQAGASLEDVALARLIVDEVDRIRRLIDRVEAFSDDRAVECRPVNIHRVLDRVRALITAGGSEPIGFREQYDPSLPHALGDEDQLIQVFLNLMKNAAEAVAERDDGRGEIVVSTAYRHGVKRGPPGRGGGSPLEVAIQDNGPGVPVGLRDQLFDPFVTTKAQGAGLGLTLVAKLVTAHGGRIDFDSEPGRTVFRVHLPVEGATRDSGVRP